jgi:hypothetical protein
VGFFFRLFVTFDLTHRLVGMAGEFELLFAIFKAGLLCERGKHLPLIMPRTRSWMQPWKDRLVRQGQTWY